MVQQYTAARPRKGRGRDLSIDSLRGVAIILMVAGNVIGGHATIGMQVADDSGWRYFYEMLADLRMPLFAALSGFVYGLRPLRDPGRGRQFVWGKTRRLLVPLVTVGTVFVLFHSLAPGTNSDLQVGEAWRMYVFGLGHLWFLQAIFLIFLVVGCADAFGWLRDRRVLLLAIGATALLSVVVRIPEAWDIFSVSGFFQLLPFFLLGYFCCSASRPDDVSPDSMPTGRWTLLAVAGGLLAARAVEVFTPVELPPRLDMALGVALGVAGISSLFAFREAIAWRPLAWLGYFSFAIYLLHIFGAAPARMAVMRVLGIESDAVVFVVALVAGLALPILFEVTFGRIRWISWAFLGQKPYVRPTWPADDEHRRRSAGSAQQRSAGRRADA